MSFTHNIFSQAPGSHWMTFEQFREVNRKRLGPYSPPFARAFMSSSGRPVNPDRQQKSYRTAHANRERLAASEYAQYVELAKLAGLTPPL